MIVRHSNDARNKMYRSEFFNQYVMPCCIVTLTGHPLWYRSSFTHPLHSIQLCLLSDSRIAYPSTTSHPPSHPLSPSPYPNQFLPLHHTLYLHLPTLTTSHPPSLPPSPYPIQFPPLHHTLYLHFSTLSSSHPPSHPLSPFPFPNRTNGTEAASYRRPGHARADRMSQRPNSYGASTVCPALCPL